MSMFGADINEMSTCQSTTLSIMWRGKLQKCGERKWVLLFSFQPNSFTNCWTAFNLLSRVPHLKMENTAIMGIQNDMSPENDGMARKQLKDNLSEKSMLNFFKPSELLLQSIQKN